MSALRTDRYNLRIYGLTHRGRPLLQDLSIVWDRRRLMPAFVAAFRRTWVEYVADVLPITRPTGPSKRPRLPNRHNAS